MQRRREAERVAEKLLAVEASMDAAFVGVAELAVLITEARGRSRLSAVVGQQVVQDLGETIAKVVEARGALVRTHRSLDAVKAEVGLRHVAIGPLEKPFAHQEGGPELTIVQPTAA